jgi:hypothetical protein
MEKAGRFLRIPNLPKMPLTVIQPIFQVVYGGQAVAELGVVFVVRPERFLMATDAEDAAVECPVNCLGGNLGRVGKAEYW